MKKVALVLAVAALACGSAFSATIVNDPYSGSEPNLYEIVNALYGTSFDSSADMEPFQIQTEIGDQAWDFATYAQVVGIFGGTGVTRTIQAFDADLNTVATVYSGTGTGYGSFGGTWINPSGLPEDVFALRFISQRGTSAPSEWSSVEMMNPDQRDHLVVYDIGEMTDGRFSGCYLLGWDGGFGATDLDFQDVVMTFCPVAPEPTSLMLVGMGLAGLAYRRFRKARI